MAHSTKRGQIVEAALELFAAEGFQAVGVDAIHRAAGVSKRTLYEYFRTKDDLIHAVLSHYSGIARNDFARRVVQSGDTPAERLLGIFDVAANWFDDDAFRGCLFINAMAEFGDDDTPLRRLCQEYKRQNREFITQLCVDAGARKAEALGEELSILFEGAIATAQVNQNPEAAQVAKRGAAVLVHHALKRGAAA